MLATSTPTIYAMSTVGILMGIIFTYFALFFVILYIMGFAIARFVVRPVLSIIKS